MGRKPSITPVVRGQVVALHQTGLSGRRIAAQLSISEHAVRNAIGLHKDTDGFVDRPHPGLSPATSTATNRLIVRTSLRNRRLTAPDIKAELHDNLGISISESTVQRRLRSAGLNGRVARKKPFISERNRRRRLSWANARVNWNQLMWDLILWSDETKFNLFGSDGRKYVRRRPGEEYNPECTTATVKHGGGGIMVWASMSAHGVGPIRLIDGIMLKEQYLAILQETMVPGARQMFGNRLWAFQHDNDPKHTARIVKAWLDQQDFNTVNWPAQSPDINPIEHLWNEVEHHVSRVRPSNLRDLWKEVQIGWNNIPPARCRNLLESMQRRCKTRDGS